MTLSFNLNDETVKNFDIPDTLSFSVIGISDEREIRKAEVGTLYLQLLAGQKDEEQKKSIYQLYNYIYDNLNIISSIVLISSSVILNDSEENYESIKLFDSNFINLKITNVELLEEIKTVKGENPKLFFLRIYFKQKEDNDNGFIEGESSNLE